MSGISFFTPVNYDCLSKSIGQCLLENVDAYFHLAGEKAVAPSGVINGSAEGVYIVNEETSFLITALKVASYFTLILPLIMLVAKVILRCTHDFYLMSEWTRRLSSLTELIQGDPNGADIYFLGNQHLEKWHLIFHNKIINHFIEDGAVLLVEGGKNLEELSIEKARKLFQIEKGKDLTVFSWDNEHVFNQQAKIYKRMIEVKDTIDNLESMDTVRNLNSEIDVLIESENQCKIARDQSMIKTIKYFRENHPEKKIFVLAGSAHFLDKESEYSILNHFKNDRCLLILPKVARTHSQEDYEQHLKKQCELSSKRTA